MTVCADGHKCLQSVVRGDFSTLLMDGGQNVVCRQQSWARRQEHLATASTYGLFYYYYKTTSYDRLQKCNMHPTAAERGGPAHTGPGASEKALRNRAESRLWTQGTRLFQLTDDFSWHPACHCEDPSLILWWETYKKLVPIETTFPEPKHTEIQEKWA